MANEIISKIELPSGIYDIRDDSVPEQLAEMHNNFSANIAPTDWSENTSTGYFECTKFNTTYPYTAYNLFIDLDWDSASEDQIKAWGEATMAGSASRNIIIVMDEEAPTETFPVIGYVFKK